MKPPVIVLVFLAVVSVQESVADDVTPQSRPMVLTCQTRSYALEDFDSGKTFVAAPDPARKIALEPDGSFSVRIGDRQVGAVRVNELSSNISVFGAPDSQKFALTYSDGGALGGFHAHVYQLTDGHVREAANPPNTALRDFSRHHFCEERGDNVFFVGWASDSKSMLIAAQVYPTSDCGPDRGIWGGYLLDMAGRILARYSDKQAHDIITACEKSSQALLPAK